LEKYGILVVDTSVVDLTFSPEFAKAVGNKQIATAGQAGGVLAQEAEQEPRRINRAKGRAEAQRLLAETLKAQGGSWCCRKKPSKPGSRGRSNAEGFSHGRRPNRRSALYL
jgi:prohibitin 1